jgi:hypothetical protein
MREMCQVDSPNFVACVHTHRSPDLEGVVEDLTDAKEKQIIYQIVQAFVAQI